jgi:hydroxymethylglutaryl-CoA reductase
MFHNITCDCRKDPVRYRLFLKHFFPIQEILMAQETLSMSGFRNLSVEERLSLLVRQGDLNDQDVQLLVAAQEAVRVASTTVENVIGVAFIPLGIATNFVIDGRPILVPMAIEEPSVIAAASNGAKFSKEGGGITTECDDPWMIGQVEIRGVPDMEAAMKRLKTEKANLIDQVDGIHPRLQARGGGARDIEFRVLDEPNGHMVVHLLLDCRDAMGANLINTACEAMAGTFEEITGGKVGLRILSNLADRRCVTARVRIPVDAFVTKNFSAERVAEGIVAASRFAELDPYRATTHNKGIMNGVDAVILACGNDWRSIEAGAHAYACRDGSYKPLAVWRLEEAEDGRFVVGELRLPMAVGIVGGGVSVNRIAQACLKLAKVQNASDLGRIAAAVGLAQNLAAVRALATEGIQRGHMSMHARSIALTLGARGEELQHVVRDVVKKGEITTDAVQRALTDLRGPDAGLTRAINKALGYALDTQEASGKWSGLSSPRIFETAIGVVALDKTGEYEEAVQKARLWLRGQAIQDHHQVAQTYEQMAYSLAMERFGAIDLSDPLLFDPVFLRKTETLAALATFAGRSLNSHVPKEKILTGIRELTDTEQKRETIKPWALADLLSVRVLLGDLEATEPLQALQWEDGSIWNNPVSTAMAFLAFSEANRVREAKLAASSLIKAQQDAGHWNYVRLDIWGTSSFIHAFSTDLEFRNNGLPQALAFLLRNQNEDGGWGYSAGIVSDNESTAQVIIALKQAERFEDDEDMRAQVRKAIRKGLEHLMGGLRPDGLWSTWQSAGDVVVADVLGHIMEAIRLCGGDEPFDFSKPIGWLSGRQDLDGGWTGGFYRNFPCVQASVLRGLPAQEPVAVKGRAALLAAANNDGGWGITPGASSCASATGTAITELCRCDADRYRSVIRNGVVYLLDRQKADGSWPCRPEMYGPRPLLFYVESVSHALTASGLIAARATGIHP